jgi:hypothetical protein
MSTATTLPQQPPPPPSSPTALATPTSLATPTTLATTTKTITLLPFVRERIVKNFTQNETHRTLIINGPRPDPKDPTFLTFNATRAQHNASIQNNQALTALRIIAPSSSSSSAKKQQHNINKTLRKTRRLLRKLRAAQLSEEAA